ncbi:LapA family protein [Pseudomonas sp. SDO5271_S396]
MTSLKRVLTLLVLVVSVLFVLLFVLENQQPISLLFLGLASPQIPVSFFVILALLVGLAAGPLFGWVFYRLFKKRDKRSV